MNTANETSKRRRGRGEGGIRKRTDGRWQGTLDLGWIDGKRRRKFVYGKTRNDVAGLLRKAHSALDAGLPVSDQRTTVSGLLETWLDGQRHGERSPNTIDNYEWAVSRLSRSIGRTRLVDLAPDDVDGLLRDMAAEDLSRSSVVRVRMVLVAALRYAERRGMVARNVAALSDVPKCKAPRDRRSLTIDEARAMLGASTEERLGALVDCGLMLGLRPGELTGLLWSDVDLAGPQITVSGSLKREGSTLQRGPVKRSRAGVRTVDLPPVLALRLRNHRARQAEERLAAGEYWASGVDYVFASEVGTPLDPANVRRVYRRIAARAGVDHTVPYELRHTAASLLIDEGRSIEEVADVLGDDPGTIYRHYRHRTRPSVDAAVAPMQRLFGTPA